MGTRTIVFDLDDTLVDTAPDLLGSLNVLFVREGLAPISIEEGRRIIGGGIKPLIEHGLALEGKTFTPAHVDTFYRDYVAHYAAHIADLSRAFPRVEAALDVLAGRGFRLAVCTNKLAFLSVRRGAQAPHGALPRPAAPDTFSVQKPDPEILRGTVGAAGGALAGTIMVGNSGTDIANARAAGVSVIAVDCGYTQVPVATLAPDRVISHSDALPAAIEAFGGAAAPEY